MAYRIAWRSKITGIESHGEAVFENKDAAISCAFIDKNRTADFQTTRGIREILSRDGNTEDIIGFLQDRNLPGDDITYKHLAEEILTLIPEQGYLTISNALQWRLQYARIVNLTEKVSGIIKIV